jgi:small subunit ribosomal protein S5
MKSSLKRVLGSSSRRWAGHRFYSTKNDSTKSQRDEHLEELKKYYPPSLIKSILAAEAAVTPEMWKNRKLNSQEFAPFYADDWAKYDPLYDYAQGEWVDKSKPRQPIPQLLPPGAALVPDEFSGNGAAAINVSKMEQLTGLSKDFLKSLTATQLVGKRVVNMTRKGKIPSFYSLAVVGNRNGLVGIGEGRDGTQMSGALMRAHWEAVKNLCHIPRFEDRTIYGRIDHKYHAVLIRLRPSPPGAGLRVNHIIHEICKAAGIKDIVGNVYRSRNPMNVAKGALEALAFKQAVAEDIAVGRGKKIADVTNTYYNF